MPAAQPTRPLSALPGRKRDHPDDDTTDVGVDAVLSADVGDAPMRQRQYTAPIEAPSASTPHAIRENTTRDTSPRVDGDANRSGRSCDVYRGYGQAVQEQWLSIPPAAFGRGNLFLFGEHVSDSPRESGRVGVRDVRRHGNDDPVVAARHQ